MVPSILQDLSLLSPSQRHTVFRLAVMGLEGFGRRKDGDGDAPLSDEYAFLKNAAQTKLFLDYVRCFMLYQKPYNTRQTDGGVVAPSAGLSIDLMTSLSTLDETYDNTIRRKLSLLSFVVAAGCSSEAILNILLIASCDPNGSVSSQGELLLKRRCAITNVKPLVNLDDPDVVEGLFFLFHGSPQIPQIPQQAMVLPASLPLRLKILSCFTRSIKAANTGASSVKTMFECLYAPSSNARLKLAGMEFAVWVLQHAEDRELRLIGPRVMGGLIKFLEEGTNDQGGLDTIRMRQFSYEAISELGRRLPAMLANNVAVASRLLELLSHETDQVRVSAMEAMRLLAGSYAQANAETKGKLQLMVTTMMKSQDASLRFLAIHWANTVFDPKDMHGLYACVLAAQDSDQKVEEEGTKVLKGWEDLLRKGNIGTDELVSYFESNLPSNVLKNAKVLESVIKIMRWVRSTEIARDDAISVPFVKILMLAMTHTEESLLNECVASALVESCLDPPRFYECVSDKMDMFLRLLGKTNDGIRQMAATLCGVIVSCTKDTQRLQRLLDALEKMDTKKQYEKFHGHALCIGHAIGHLLLDGKDVPESVFDTYYGVLRKNLHGSSHHVMNAGISSILGKIAFCKVGLLANGLEEVIGDLKRLAESSNAKVSSSAIIALGQFGNAFSNTDDAAFHGDAFQGLHSALSRFVLTVGEDGQYALGEAISLYFGRLALTKKQLLVCDSSLEPSVKEQICAHTFTGAESQGKAGKERAEHVPLCDAVLSDLMTKYAAHPQPKVRRNASIALTSLVRNTKEHPSVTGKIIELQSTFCELLKDTDEVTQEMASQGISTVYTMSGASDSVQEALVESLIGSLTASQIGPKKVKLSDDVEMFDENLIGRDPTGEKISTYKHLCSVATEIGQPDMVYQFINIFNDKNLLRSRQGAAAGLTSIATIAEEQITAHLPKLVPKLYRLLHDPSPGVQESMYMFWCSLVKDPQATVGTYFKAILEELMVEITSHLWRNRQSAASALADLISAREWEDLKDEFGDIWMLAFRAIDDIKETVRLAGMTLISQLRRTTLRLCEGAGGEDAGASNTGDGTASPGSVVFPVLLEKGITSPVKEVKGISLKMLSDLIKWSDAALLRAHLSDMVKSLLPSLSGLEDPTVNYVEQHADKVGLTKEKIDSLRVTASNQSIVGEMLDRVAMCVDEGNLEEVCVQVSKYLRNGFGTSTCAGAARFLTSITLRLRYDMQSVSGRLLKSLMTSVRGQSNAVVHRAYASAFAQVAKFSAEGKVEPRIQSLVEDAESEDKSTAYAAAVFTLELERQAPDVFSRYQQIILPKAFILKRMESEKVSALWKSVWEEAAPSLSTAMRLFHEDIFVMCERLLASSKWAVRAGAVAAVEEVLQHSDGIQFSDAAKSLCEVLGGTLKGRWDGKQKAIEVHAALTKRIA